MLLSKIVIQELVLGNLPSLSYPEMQVQPFTNPLQRKYYRKFLILRLPGLPVIWDFALESMQF